MVLIERGREVGGGEQRFSVGTVAEITQLGARKVSLAWSLKAAGASRSPSGSKMRRIHAQST